ncbi:Uncharacterised protein [Cedecea neteri]|uniref:Uncharacterized protein n=1 Tax=Cedecea neteri TaxID=158822 RepID=A0A2X2VBA8_9ENTR|nr:Uncharacterised protein [Cedecea neteri]
MLLQSLSPGGLVTNILGYVGLVKFPFTFSQVLYAAPRTGERLGRITVISPRPRTPGEINRPLKRQTSVLSPSPESAEMRSRRSQPPAVPDVRTLASRRENGGDLSRNRAAPGYDPTQAGVELPGAAKESDRRERIANDPECLGDSRWVYRFSGDELAGRRGLSGGMA